jgi:hypothetical protein
MKKYIARPGQKVTIEIHRKAKVQSPKSKVQSRKGIIPLRREDDYLARRGGGIYLNFYDFGQFTEDGVSWQEFDWVVSKTINTDTGQHVIDLAQLSLTDWDALKDQIFATDKNEWKNVFRKFEYEKAERYGIDIYLGKLSTLDNPTIDESKYFPVGRDASRHYIQWEKSADLIAGTQWTEKGLRIKKKQTTEAFTLLTHSGFINLISFNSSKTFKVTSEPDYDAEEVEFIVDASTDFYLVPMFTIEYAIDQTSSAELYLNLLYSPLERNFFIDGAGWNPSEWEYSPFTERECSYTGAATANTNHLVNYFKSRTEARSFKETVGAVSPAGFPSTHILLGLDGAQAFSTSADSDARLVEGAFLAAAKKKNKWFYFWSTSERTNHNSAGFLARTQKFRLTIS